jgi:hypothetical protein
VVPFSTSDTGVENTILRAGNVVAMTVLRFRPRLGFL